MKFLLAACLILIPAATMAEMRHISGAYICDTLEQLVETFDKAKPPATEIPEVEGCGFLAKPTLAFTETLPRYENKHGAIYPVKLTFPEPLGVQYGYERVIYFDEIL